VTIRGFAATAPDGTQAATPELDESQRAVLDLGDDASAAVLGAPGSGKTTTAVELVADRIASRGFAPDEIVVLTPTRVSATRLRDRLARRVGVPSNGPMARTATSLAFQLVGRVARANGAEPPRLLTGGEQDQIIADLLAGHIEDGTGPLWPDPLTPDVRRLRGFRTELRELMARCLEHGVTPEELARLGHDGDVPEWVAASAFIAEYQRVIDSYRASYVDSTELLAEASLVLREHDVLGGTRLVVLDDAQEVTSAALSLVRSIAARGVPVIAFGDPDVATTAFRGADAAALGQLGMRLGIHAHTLVLSTVHRHGHEVRTLVRRATDRIGASAAGRQRAALARVAPREPRAAAIPPVVRVEAPSPAAETAVLARILREHHLLRGVPWSQMMVVVRSGARVPSLARALSVAEVPTRMSAGGRALREDYAARQLIQAVALALGLAVLTPETASELLIGPLGGLDAVALRRLRLALRQEEIAGGGSRSGDDLLVEALLRPDRLTTIESGPARRASKLAASLEAVRVAAGRGATIEELLWEVWDRSGLATTWLHQSERSGILADEADRHLDGVVALFTAAKRFVERSPDAPASGFLEELLGSELPEDTLAPQAAADAVLVCTPSGAIGTEVRVVAVAGLQEGIWPNLRLRGSLVHPQDVADRAHGVRRQPTSPADERAGVMADELRMFALSVSRAGEQVVLTSTSNDDEQPSPFLRFADGLCDDRPPGDGLSHPLSLRGLAGRLRRDLVRGVAPAFSGRPTTRDDAAVHDAATALAMLARAEVPGADPSTWYGLLEPSTTEPLVDLTDPQATVRVSPSKVETFETSPLAWFIDEMAADPGGLAAGIGTVVHAVMEEVAASDDPDTGIERIWRGVEERWSQLEFESPWIEERQRRRTRRLAQGLAGYLADFERSGGVLLGSEGGFQLTTGRATLSGKIDRIERTASGAVVIVDLKTGNYGPTAAKVAEHAQLGSYQLAVAAGALPAVPADAPAGGAKLLFVGVSTRAAPFREYVQDVLDEAGLSEFRDRIEHAAVGMAGNTFDGVLELDQHDPHARYQYRIHLIPAVSA
jgi:superfamily I DNA/RNA helicase/RecB family exonuclease